MCVQIKTLPETLLKAKLAVDTFQILELFNHYNLLKSRFRGFFPAKFPFFLILKNDNTFMIMKASPSDQPGIHWLLFCSKAGAHIVFADPPRKKFCDYIFVYKNMRCTIHERNQLLMKNPIQSVDPVLCGFYDFYVAHVKITTRLAIGFKPNDHEFIKFAKGVFARTTKLFFFLIYSYQKQIFHSSSLCKPRKVSDQILRNNKAWPFGLADNS